MNIQRNKQRKLIMNLEQALLQYGNDINYIILRDGTNIEIIDDFIEENIEDNYGYDNYMYKEIDQNGTLRGRGLKKSLRKTVLKSNNNQGKLRFGNNYNNNIDNNKVIIKQTEDNEYLQCANCFKFFNSKESDEETENSSNINDNNNNIINIYNNKNQYNEKMRPQMPAQIPPKQNQQYPPYQPNIPKQVMPPQQKYNQNNINNFNPPPYNNPQYQQRGPQQRMNIPNVPPQSQLYYYNNNQIPKGNMRIPGINNQNNQVFRERKRNSGKYQQKEIGQNNYVVNKYPGSGKKQINNEYDANYYKNDTKYYEYPSINYAHSSNKQQNNNYYQNDVNEFQENDSYGY